MSFPVVAGYAVMILVEIEHDIRVATYGVQVVPGYAFEVADKRADLLVTHDAAVTPGG